MFHAVDAERIASMLGVVDPPEELEREYDKWLSFAQRGGKTGPLGTELLTVLLASRGYVPPPPEDLSKGGVNWRKVPIGQPVLVYDNGVKVSGQFSGIVGAGTLAVKIDDDPLIREFRASDVEIPAPKEFEPSEFVVAPEQFGEFSYGDEVKVGELTGKVVGYDGSEDKFFVVVDEDTMEVPSGDLVKA